MSRYQPSARETKLTRIRMPKLHAARAGCTLTTGRGQRRVGAGCFGVLARQSIGDDAARDNVGKASYFGATHLQLDRRGDTTSRTLEEEE
jgi:hypothetical protein